MKIDKARVTLSETLNNIPTDQGFFRELFLKPGKKQAGKTSF